MANDLSALIPRLIALGVQSLRAQTIMPRLVNTDYSLLAAQKGDVINIAIPSAVAAVAVAPANTPPTTADSAPTSVPLQLDKWFEAAFYMTDKDILEVLGGRLPMQAQEAIIALATQVDDDILANYTGIYGATGTPGTAPFATDTSDYTSARKVLNNQLAPTGSRRVVLNPDAEGNALNLRAFQDASFGGGSGVIVNGQIGAKMGADWFMDQRVPDHVAGTISNGTIRQALINVTVVAGATTMNLDSATLTGTLVLGDIFTVAGVAGTFVVTNDPSITAAANAMVGVTFSPAAPAGGFVDGAAVTVHDDHAVNLLIHRDAFAFASRPPSDIGSDIAAMQAVTDPVSGLSIRLEVTREHKRTRFAYDILYGTALARAALGTRIVG